MLRTNGRLTSEHWKACRLGSDEVSLNIGWEWVAASQEIRRRSGELGRPASRLFEAPHWERREVDLKGLTNLIAEHLDSRQLQRMKHRGGAQATCRSTARPSR